MRRPRFYRFTPIGWVLWIAGANCLGLALFVLERVGAVIAFVAFLVLQSIAVARFRSHASLERVPSHGARG